MRTQGESDSVLSNAFDLIHRTLLLVSLLLDFAVVMVIGFIAISPTGNLQFVSPLSFLPLTS
jgi:hypothetical protein